VENFLIQILDNGLREHAQNAVGVCGLDVCGVNPLLNGFFGIQPTGFGNRHQQSVFQHIQSLLDRSALDEEIVCVGIMVIYHIHIAGFGAQ